MCACVCVCVCDFSSVVRGGEGGGGKGGGEGGGGWSVFVVSGVGSNKRCGVGEVRRRYKWL